MAYNEEMAYHPLINFLMELLVLFTSLLFVFMVLKIAKKRSKSNDNNFNPPQGPWKLPLIGSLHHLVGSLPHRRLRDLAKKYGPFMHLQLGEISAIVVSSPEYAKEVMKNHDISFASRPQTLASKVLFYDSSDIIFSPYGDYWRQLRKICTSELLSTKRVHSFRSIREEEVSDLVRWIATKADSPINLSEKVESLIYGIVSRAAFGKKSKDQESFVSVINETMKVASGLNIADLFPSVKLLQLISGIKPRVDKLHREADRIIENIINEHKKRREQRNVGRSEEFEDLVDVLLNVQENNEFELTLTTDNIKAVIFVSTFTSFTMFLQFHTLVISFQTSELKFKPNSSI